MLPKNNSIPSPLHLIVGVFWIYLFYQWGQVTQDHFLGILAWATPLFIIYGYILSSEKVSLVWWMTMAIGARFIIAFNFPLLSDDIYRFYFDGNMILQGINPYGLIPAQHPELFLKIPEPLLLNKMNSADYYTVYPPLAQTVFALAAWTGSIVKAKITMALLMISLEGIAMVFLYSMLKKLKMPPTNMFWYYMNPLVIMEGMGNVHFDIFVATSLVMMIYFLFEKSYVKAGVWWAVGIGFKLTPLLLLPLLFAFFNRDSRKIFFGVAGFTLLILFLPFMIAPGFFTIFKSINLYFQSFEFNAGIYYGLRQLGILISGYNLIFYLGPLLALTTLAILFKISKQIVKGHLNQFSMLASLSWLSYLWFSTTVHPWYLIPPLIMTVFVRQLLLPVWSFLALFSYIHYDPELSVYEPVILCVEYAVVFLLFFYNHRFWISKWQDAT